MQFSVEERERFLAETTERISHHFRLQRHCETLHGTPIENLIITSFRRNYVVTGTVGSRTFRESVLRTDELLTQSVESHFVSIASDESHSASTTSSHDDFDLALCCGSDCNAVGPLGTLCTESDCEDSGNIYADLLRPAKTTAFPEQE